MIGIQRPPKMINDMAAATGMVRPQVMPTQITANTTVAPVATAQPMPVQNVPQTGLIGAESALNQGSQSAIGSINQGYDRASQALSGILGGLSAPTAAQPVSYSGGVDTRSISAGLEAATKSVNESFGRAEQVLGDYNTGASAGKLQADLSGANGAEAQQAAMQAVQSNPYSAQMQENAERAILRNAAATGNLGGGNVLDQLYKNAASTFAQDYQNRFQNLGEVAGRGLGAASQIAQTKQQQAATQAGLAQADLSGRYGLASQSMANSAQMAIADMQAKNALQRDTLGIRANIATRLADLAENTGLNIAGINAGASQQIAQGRYQAGRDIAASASAAANNISSILQNQGVQVSEMMGKDIASLTDLIYQGGMQDKIDSQNLAAILANITGGQASNIMQGQTNIGAAKAGGTLGVADAITQGAGMYLAYGNNGSPTAKAGTGGAISDYTGKDYSNWLANQ